MLDGSRRVLLAAEMDDAFVALLEVAHLVGVVSYVDRQSAVLETIVTAAPGEATSLLIFLEPGEEDGVTEAFLGVEPLGGHAPAPLDPLVDRIAELLARERPPVPGASDAVSVACRQPATLQEVLRAGPARRVPAPPGAAVDAVRHDERPQRLRPLLLQRPRPHRRPVPHHRARRLPEPRRDRRVRDAAHTAIGRSRCACPTRSATSGSNQHVGPYRIEVIEPLEKIRLICEAAEHGLAFDLTWDGSFPAVEEPRHVWRRNGRITLDACRFAQVGTWSGEIEVEGEKIAVTPGHAGSGRATGRGASGRSARPSRRAAAPRRRSRASGGRTCRCASTTTRS